MSTPATLSATGLRATMTTYGGLLRPPRGHQSPERLSGARRGHRHQHGPHASSRCRRPGGPRRGRPPGRGRHGHRPRVVDGGAGQLRGHLVPVAARLWWRPFPPEARSRRHEVAEGLARADELARQAVVRPVEGTILSVARAGAEGAGAPRSVDGRLSRGARDEASEALARTPEQLAVLKQAGVVDSGGTGLVLFFDALCHVFAGDALPDRPQCRDRRRARARGARRDAALGELRYEVMYLLEARRRQDARLSRGLGRPRRLDRHRRR